MDDREKVIKGLESLNTRLINCQDWLDAHIVDDAIALLKEPEAVKPKVLIDTWICGDCGATLERQSMCGDILIHDIYEYCPNCGRKVKWNG